MTSTTIWTELTGLRTLRRDVVETSAFITSTYAKSLIDPTGIPLYKCLTDLNCIGIGTILRFRLDKVYVLYFDDTLFGK